LKPSEKTEYKVKPKVTARENQALGSTVFNQTLNPTENRMGAPARMEAKTVQTSTGQTIFEPKVIHSISHQVNHLAQAKQDGELRIRLKPDHLGEMVLNVRTQGQNVSLSIKTEHSEAKKIIEESLGGLKEQLGQLNLVLSQIDLQGSSGVTAQNQFQSGQFDQNQNGLQFDLNQGGGRQPSDSGSFAERSERPSREGIPSAKMNTGAVASRYGKNLSQSGLDLIA
jgi:flagellar hook-length control protein FliK